MNVKFCTVRSQLRRDLTDPAALPFMTGLSRRIPDTDRCFFLVQGLLNGSSRFLAAWSSVACSAAHEPPLLRFANLDKE